MGWEDGEGGGQGHGQRQGGKLILVFSTDASSHCGIIANQNSKVLAELKRVIDSTCIASYG